MGDVGRHVAATNVKSERVGTRRRVGGHIEDHCEPGHPATRREASVPAELRGGQSPGTRAPQEAQGEQGSKARPPCFSEPSRSRKRLIGVIGTASLDDPGLVRAAMAGDELAFDALVGPLIPHAYRLAAVFLRDPGEAEDAVQEACLKAWRSLDRLRRDTAVRAWFLTIVANQCRSMRRARWWSVVRRATVERSEPTLMEGQEDRMDLDREVSRLPDTDRAVLFLFFYLDLPLAEVARILKISPQAAKSRVHRAVTRMRLDMVEVSK